MARKSSRLPYLAVFAGGIVLALVFIGLTNRQYLGPLESNFGFIIPSPTPTPDPDPIINCSSVGDKGQVYCPAQEMRSSQCQSVVCCPLSDGSWTFASKIDCARYRDQYNANHSIPPPVLMMPMYDPYIYR